MKKLLFSFVSFFCLFSFSFCKDIYVDIDGISEGDELCFVYHDSSNKERDICYKAYPSERLKIHLEPYNDQEINVGNYKINIKEKVLRKTKSGEKQDIVTYSVLENGKYHDWEIKAEWLEKFNGIKISETLDGYTGSYSE